MEKGQSQSKANKGMRRFVSGRSCAVFNCFKNKKKRAEKESIEGASSPSSFHPTPNGEGSDIYEVFLSFDESDTRKEFIDRLRDELVAAGICVFNHNSIQTGEEFGSLRLDAITRSKISIPIISEGYASSKCCLRQLIHIMDRNKSGSHVALPIFYNVPPSDVWYLHGSSGDEKDIQEGQQALKEVSRLNGWTCENYASGQEGELVEQVVEAVQRELREGSRLLVPKELVGLDFQLKCIMELADVPSDHSRMIGIHGMGGIGKTTLAKCIYNQLSTTFDHVCFLPDIREIAHLHKIEYLQSRLISEILRDNIPVSTVEEGTNIIKSKLSGKKVLILLDDIDHKDQLDALAGERNWFASGSIIIVTARTKAVLDQSEFHVDYEHQMSEIDAENSLVLFNKHAFRKVYCSWELEVLSHHIVSIMGGLPLALVVIGSYLYRKTIGVWKDLLKKLREKRYGGVREIMRISYDALEDEHKEIFLDIAWFFMVKESEVAMYMRDGCGSHASKGIEELNLRGLIKIEDDGKLKMHDELRNLGLNIIRGGQLPKKYSGLCADEEAFRGLTGKKGTTVTEALCCDEFRDYQFLDYGSSIHLQADKNGQFEKLQRFRFLRLRDPTSSGDLNDFLSEVRWLWWIRIELNPSFSATNLHLPKLLVLHLSHSSITEDWKGWSSITAAKRLKALRLEYLDSLKCTPDLSALTDLEILVFKNCERLEQVHTSIGKVKSLASLDFSGCGSLEELPGEVGDLEELKELILDSTGVTEIPTSIGSLRKLEKLSARFCVSLREIPSSIGDLQNLQHLDITGSSIEKLPSDIGGLKVPNLSAFPKLKIISRFCHKLKQVSPSIGKVKNLVSLDLSCCDSLEELSGEVGDLEELKELILDSTGITEIPTSIGSLRKLEKLSARHCRSLREIPSSIGDFQNLQHLDISVSPIEKLPSDIGRLQQLRRLHLHSCHRLSGEIPREIGDLSSLESLEITEALISDLPESIRNLSSLRRLKLWRCDNIRVLPELPSGLKYLEASYRGPSPRLPDFSRLIHLEVVVLSWKRST